MSDREPTTIREVADDGSLIEMDLDAEQAERRERGQSYGSYETRRLSNGDAIARVEAERDELLARRDQMVSDNPALKCLPLRRQPDDGEDDPPPAA